MFDDDPIILVSELPEGEQADADHLCFLVDELDRYLDRYHDALAWFDMAAEGRGEILRIVTRIPGSHRLLGDRRILSALSFMAARDAVMTIYHFGWTLKGIKEQNHHTMRQWIDYDALKASGTMWESEFKTSTKIRHAVGHEGEETWKPGKKARNSLTENSEMFPEFELSNSTLFIGSHLRNRTLIMPFSGGHYEFEISEATLHKLHEIRVLVRAAFAPVAAATHEIRAARRKPQ